MQQKVHYTSHSQVKTCINRLSVEEYVYDLVHSQIIIYDETAILKCRHSALII